MATNETEAGVDVVSKPPGKGAELRYRISVDDSGTKATLASISATRASEAVDGGSLVFSTDAIGGDVAPRMVIDLNGNVGIGLSEPRARLHVDGDALFSGPLTISGALSGQSLSMTGSGEFRGALVVGGDVTVTGKVKASGFVGDGAELTNIGPKNDSIGSAQLAGDPGSLGKLSGGKVVIKNDRVGVGLESPDGDCIFDVGARMKVRQGGSASAGIWFAQTGVDHSAFVGMADNNRIGFWGGGAGWGLTMNKDDGRVIVTKLQLGNKWLLSGDRDWWADDDWLRLGNTQVGGYWGGFAAGRLWSSSGTLSGSDVRLKSDISSLGNMVDKLMALRGVRFKWRDAKDEEPHRIGLIAQEVEEIIPEVVETGPDGMKGINYAGLVAAIIGVLQDQEAELRRLQAEVAGAPDRICRRNEPC
jgi:hypothetical protein